MLRKVRQREVEFGVKAEGWTEAHEEFMRMNTIPENIYRKMDKMSIEKEE
jgi:hypothetical protein